MTDEDFKISEEPPRDDHGHPVHPERGHRICGAVKSDRTTPTDHGRERDDYEYCLLPAGWGAGDERDEGPCSKHPVSGEQWGESNPNFKTGATSDYFKSKLSERQQDVYDEVADALADPESAMDAIRYMATQMMLVGEHANDAAMVREGRQLLSEFGVVEVPADRLELEADVDVEQTTTHELGEDEKDIALEVIRQRQEQEAGGDDE